MPHQKPLATKKDKPSNSDGNHLGLQCYRSQTQIPDPPSHDHHHDGSVYAGVPDPDPPRRQLQKCFPPTAANYVIKGAAYVDFFVFIFLCLAAKFFQRHG